MRFGLVSDVHANLEALTVVLRRLDRLRVDRVVSLGDAIGYHANPNECLSLLSRAGARAIAGNHDRAAAGVYEPTWFGAVARHAVHWTRSVLQPDHAARLCTLDVFGWLDEQTCMVHAALHPEPNERYHLSTPERLQATFAKLRSGEIPARVCFFGHTHQAVVHRFDGRTATRVPVGSLGRVELDDGFYLVNPGSVGQPRDGDSRAAFAIFDSDANSVEFHRADYDTRACLNKAEAAGLLAPAPSRWRSLLSRVRAR